MIICFLVFKIIILQACAYWACVYLDLEELELIVRSQSFKHHLIITSLLSATFHSTALTSSDWLPYLTHRPTYFRLLSPTLLPMFIYDVFLGWKGNDTLRSSCNNVSRLKWKEDVNRSPPLYVKSASNPRPTHSHTSLHLSRLRNSYA